MKKEPQVKLPPFKVENVMASLSQVIDWGLTQSKVPDTWRVTQGEGVTVYVLDSGGTDHPDLKNNVAGSKSFVAESVEDKNGHSTHCAGIICAENNAGGMVGVAPKAKVVLFKVLTNNGSGPLSSVVNALNFCIEINQGQHPEFPKVDVISMSLGAGMGISQMETALNKLKEMNIPVVCAAGNDGARGISFPAKYDSTIAIGAHDKYKRIANFSNYGPSVDFVAPGVDIYSTYPNRRYAKLSGTSMATPFVSGIIALMLSKHAKQEKETGKNDCKTVDQIIEHLIKYSIDNGPAGKDEKWGNGIIDVRKLIVNHSESGAPVPRDIPKRKIKQGFFSRLFRWMFG